MAEDKNATFENHVQTALQMIIIMIVGWVGMTTNKSAVDIAALSAKVEVLQTQVEYLQQQQRSDLERRLEALEK